MGTSVSALERDRSRALHLVSLETRKATEIEKIATATEIETGIETEIEIKVKTAIEIAIATVIETATAIEGEERPREKQKTRIGKIRTETEEIKAEIRVEK